METQEWLKERRLGLGGTDIAAIMGLNKYKNAKDVWLDKLGKSEEIQPNDRMKMGTMLEPVVAKLYEESNDVTLTKASFIRSQTHPFLCGSPDYIDEKNQRLVEIKTVGGYALKSWNNEIPTSYWLQMQHYMHLTGLRNGVLVTLCDGVHYREWHVEYNVEYYEALIPKFFDWWNVHVVGMNEPELVDVKPTADPSLGILSADEQAKKWYYELLELRELSGQIEDKISEVRSNIEKFMSSSTELYVDGECAITWKESTRETIDSKRFKETFPLIYAEFAKSKTTRTFSVKDLR